MIHWDVTLHTYGIQQTTYVRLKTRARKPSDNSSFYISSRDALSLSALSHALPVGLFVHVCKDVVERQILA